MLTFYNYGAFFNIKKDINVNFKNQYKKCNNLGDINIKKPKKKLKKKEAKKQPIKSTKQANK